MIFLKDQLLKRIILGIILELKQTDLALKNGDTINVEYHMKQNDETDDLNEDELEHEIAKEIMGLSDLEEKIIQFTNI